jgi:hypothetical protein
VFLSGERGAPLIGFCKSSGMFRKPRVFCRVLSLLARVR